MRPRTLRTSTSILFLSLALAGGTTASAFAAGQGTVASNAPPETTITDGPSGLTDTHVSTFTFVSSAAGSTFECRVDAGPFAACTSPFSTSSLANGPHTFEVRAITADGADPTPATRSFRVDTVAPQTTITGGPSGTTSDNTPTFTFRSSADGVAFECRIDAAEFSACTTPFTTPPLAGGEHTVRVRTIDAVGNTDPSPASRTFSISAGSPPPSAPSCQGSEATIVGTAGDDRIEGTRGRDVIVSLGGDDVVRSGGGNDLVCTGGGDDRAAGAGGKDLLVGQAGSDRLVGGGQADRLLGRGGDDRLGGGGGDDRLDGGNGRDLGRGGAGKDVVVRCET